MKRVEKHTHHARRGTLRRFRDHVSSGKTLWIAMAAVAGPGLLAGLSDDDPAGITTYSILGTDFGYRLLWIIPISTAILIIFHLLAMRVGTMSGKGFSAVVRDEFGIRWAWIFCALFVAANFGTICAEYAGIAAVAQLLDWPSWMLVIPSCAVMCVALVRASFHRIEHVLMTISIMLALYIPAAFISGVDWGKAAHGTLVPGGWGLDGAAVVLAATLGTTLAPWGLSFIQSYAVDKGLTHDDYRLERFDVTAGSILTGIIGMCIALTCAATLHAQGIHINDAGDVARALEPLAGDMAVVLFGAGLFGAALLAAALVPLATAYSVSEGLGKNSDLDKHFGQEKLFYLVMIVLSILAASIVVLPGMNIIKLIYYSQVINGVLLLPQIVALVVLGRRAKLMGDLRLKRIEEGVAWGAVVIVMACIALLVLN